MDKAKAPTKVLYVENGIGYGGAVICLRHLVRNLDRSRFEPFVVTGLSTEPYRGIADEATWLPIPDRRVDVARARSWVASAPSIQAIPGARWLLFKLLARLDDLLNFVPFFLALVVQMLRVRPALVHVNNDPYCNRAAVVAAKLLGVPVVAHVRGDQGGYRVPQWLYRIPGYFVAVSRWVNEDLQKLMNVPAERTSCVYDGIELDKLDQSARGAAFRSRHGVPDDAFAVGLVGLLIPWKGQKLFLEACALLQSRIPNLHVLLVGGTPEKWRDYERELRASADASTLRDRIVFTGHVSNMCEAYNGLDVVVSASTSPEPLGTVVIESLALGRPLVAPAFGGAREMVDHESTGLLFQPGSASHLASAIERLYRDRALSAALGEAARSKALATFSVQEHVRRVQAIYERVLGKGSSQLSDVHLRAGR
jgi:glycosyltransferase involved in cell wall biosynthesis